MADGIGDLSKSLRSSSSGSETGRSGWFRSSETNTTPMTSISNTAPATTKYLVSIAEGNRFLRPVSEALPPAACFTNIMKQLTERSLCTLKGRSWRAGIDVSHDYELVTRGLFGLVRNPFYTGFIVASAVVFLMSPNLVTLLGWVMVVAGCEVHVRLVEEPHLRATRGNDYSEYEKRVPRFIPRLGSSV